MGRFTFPQTSQANLLFKLGAAATNTSIVNWTVVSSTEVSGAITSGHFCASSPTYTLYFDMVFDRPFTANSSFGGGYSVTFDASANRVVQAKVGLSYVSASGAVANRTTENPGWDFNGTRTATHNAWNDYLNKIKISGGTADQQTVFYTALYHALLHPNVYSDVDGRYTGFDYRAHSVTGAQRAQYANFSGWDIYRSQAQLMALVAPQPAGDSAQSLLNDYNQFGLLPKWALNQAETYVMNGDAAPPTIAAYYAFGARNFDTNGARAAMVKQATTYNGIRTGLHYLGDYGYLPADGSYEYGFYGTVATTLEYAASDFAISAFAGALGDTTDQTSLANRAQSWRNLLNPASGFLQPKNMNGSWKAGFDPASSSDMVEGTSWQYTGMVPFNVRGLADAKGGNAAMAAYLDSVLSDLHGSGGTHADLGNEPSMELPWEYDYIGQPWKAQQKVRQVQNELWPNSPANWGVGNDDLGTMSAWYVFSAIGMYPMTPGTADMALGSPLFTDVVVSPGGGGTIHVTAPQAATNVPYVQSATLNGATWNNAYLPPVGHDRRRHPRVHAGHLRQHLVGHRREQCPAVLRGQRGRPAAVGPDAADRGDRLGRGRQVPRPEQQRHHQRHRRAAVGLQPDRRAAVALRRRHRRAAQPTVRPLPRRPQQQRQQPADAVGLLRRDQPALDPAGEPRRRRHLGHRRQMPGRQRRLDRRRYRDPVLDLQRLGRPAGDRLR